MSVAYSMRVVYNYDTALPWSMGRKFPADAGAGSYKKTPQIYYARNVTHA